MVSESTPRSAARSASTVTLSIGISTVSAQIRRNSSRSSGVAGTGIAVVMSGPFIAVCQELLEVAQRVVGGPPDICVVGGGRARGEHVDDRAPGRGDLIPHGISFRVCS